MNKKTKTILIVSFSILFVGICIGVYFLIFTKPKSYPESPIQQTSLYTNPQVIDVKNIKVESKDYPLFEVSNKVDVEKVEEFAMALDPKMKKTANVEGKLYKWENKENYVLYELEQNTVLFNVSNGIVWNEVDISSFTFKTFFKQYFEKDWDFEFLFSEKTVDGFTVYYANRLFESYKIETSEYNGQTDYLGFKDGKIIYGKILLTEFSDTKQTLPLLNSKDLEKYVNISKYPKEIYPNYSTLQETLLSKVSYLTQEFVDITKTMNECIGDSLAVTYLYKNFGQKYLTPVYKIELQCEITYKETKYNIPAVGYVNAVDPKYISIPE